MSQFENLVFEGGGVKGIAYVGAIAVLEKTGMLADIRRVAGTSAGAIAACLLALGADAATTRRIVTSTPFASFEDSDFGVVRDTWRLIHRYGWYKGDAFAEWLKKQVTALSGNPELDFKTLADWAEKEPGTYRQLYVTGTDISAQRAKIFSADTTPDMPLWKAVRISMSLPLVFASVKREGDVWVDGGLTWNYPIDLFDQPRYMQGQSAASENGHYNRATLGLRVDSRVEITSEQKHFGPPAVKIDDFVAYAKALVGFMIDAANHAHLEPRDWHRTVFIDAHGISTTDFDLTTQQISMLVESGRLGTQAWLKWFEDASERPLNRVD